MPSSPRTIKQQDEWNMLTRLTTARIALGRAGMSLTTKAHLDFQLAHSQARDAVHNVFDYPSLQQKLSGAEYQTIQLSSQAANLEIYLQRPDKGRLLDENSVEIVKQHIAEDTSLKIAIVIADGLSPLAIERHAFPFLQILMPALYEHHFNPVPICLVKHGRVAVGDHVGEIVSAQMSVVLIGERPGLSSPDSMGIYFTYQPKLGVNDAGRNCISNIHQNGLSYSEALKKLLFLITEAQQLKLSGVHLKEDASLEDQSQTNSFTKNFLLE